MTPELLLVCSMLREGEGLRLAPPPDWVIPALIHVETSSTITSGTINRRNNHNDRDSVGVLQCRPIAFKDVQTQFPGRKFNDQEFDDNLAMAVCVAYIIKWRHKGEPWVTSVCRWNGGPRNVPLAYKMKVTSYLDSKGIAYDK